MTCFKLIALRMISPNLCCVRAVTMDHPCSNGGWVLYQCLINRRAVWLLRDELKDFRLGIDVGAGF